LINHNVDNIFNRSGLGALSDLNTPEYQSIFAQLEKEQEAFLDKETEFRSAEYKWPHDPLHQWSRAWEYPYIYYHLSSNLGVLPQYSRPVIADVGSGVTFFPFSLAKLGHQVVCTDIDPICEKDLSRAIKSVLHSPGRVEFRLLDNTKLPFEDCECDAVYCISVLEHIPDFENTVTEMARILKPGGLCLITCDINLMSADDRQLTFQQYMRLMAVIDASFVRGYPDRTIHPVDVLTTINSPYPLGRHLGVVKTGYQLLKQKILKPLMGRNPGMVNNAQPYLGVLGLILEKSK